MLEKKKLFRAALLLIPVPMMFVLSNSCQSEISNIPERIPAEVFFKGEQKSGFKLSPDGRHISYIGHDGPNRNLYIQETGNDNEIQLTEFTIGKFAHYYWIHNNRLIFSKDSNGDRRYKVYSVDIRDKKVNCLTDYPNSYSIILSTAAGSEDEIIIESNMRDPEFTDVYRLNILTGNLESVFKGSQESKGYFQFYVDYAGKLRLARSREGIMIMNDQTGDFEELLVYKEENERFMPEYFSQDNKSVYAYSNIGRDKFSIVEFNLESRTETRILIEDPNYDVYTREERNDEIVAASNFYYSPSKNKLLYSYHCTDSFQLHYFDNEIGQIIETIKKKAGDHPAVLESYSDDLDKFIFKIFSDRIKGAYYLYERETGKLNLIHNLSNWLNEEELAETKPVHYEAGDGLTIHGFLTVPKGVEAKNLPVVACIHGGPTLRDTPGYNDIVQFFANRGYLVFQVNYRGSHGYGSDFVRAGYKQWGLKIHDDIIDGLDWLKERGMIDKSRIAFYGFSSGGYEAIAGITFHPDLYACSIAISGNVNLASSFKIFSQSFQSKWGDPEKDQRLLHDASPFFHIEKIKTPLMIVNGVKDGSIPILEVDEFVNLLRKQGNEVEYLRYENEGHNIIYNPELKLEVFNKIDKFLERHLGGRRTS